MPRKRTTGKTHDKNGREMTVRARIDMPMVNFTKALDQNALKNALAAYPEDSRYRQLLELMLTPYQGSQPTLSTLCRKVNVSLTDLMNLMKDYHVAEGTIRMMQQLPQVMEDVGEDAKSQMKPCPRCDGEGTLKEERATEDGVHLTKQCPECKGKGEQRVTGDKHARDLMFETAKLTNQRGPLVAQQFNTNIGPQSGLKQIMQDTEDLL